MLGHDGGTIGQAAFLRVVPDAGVAVALLTNGGNAIALFRDTFGELLSDLAGVELPAESVPPEPPLPVDAAGYVGVYEREGASIRVFERDGGIAAVQTITGLGSELAPEPIELPLLLAAADDDLFLTQHPAAPGLWHPVRFVDAAGRNAAAALGRPRDPEDRRLTGRRQRASNRLLPAQRSTSAVLEV